MYVWKMLVEMSSRMLEVVFMFIYFISSSLSLTMSLSEIPKYFRVHIFYLVKRLLNSVLFLAEGTQKICFCVDFFSLFCPDTNIKINKLSVETRFFQSVFINCFIKNLHVQCKLLFRNDSYYLASTVMPPVLKKTMSTCAPIGIPVFITL